MSTVRNDIALLAEQYLQMRRAMGYQLRQQGQMVLDFATYFHATDADHVSTAIILDWVTRHSIRTRHGGMHGLALSDLLPSSFRLSIH